VPVRRRISTNGPSARARYAHHGGGACARFFWPWLIGPRWQAERATTDNSKIASNAHNPGHAQCAQVDGRSVHEGLKRMPGHLRAFLGSWQHGWADTCGGGNETPKNISSHCISACIHAGPSCMPSPARTTRASVKPPIAMQHHARHGTAPPPACQHYHSVP
jgi:hypothetical protein